MKKLLPLIIIVAFFNCQNVSNTEYSKTDSLDLSGRSIEEIKDSLRDVIETKVNDEVFGDTVGVYKSPIKVVKYRMVQDEYSSYRDVELTYKNVSDKKVTGIRFKWKGVNAFGELADMGSSFAKGYGGGFSDDTLRPGKTETSQWSVLSRDGKKILMAWAYEVVFEDGTVWKLKE